MAAKRVNENEQKTKKSSRKIEMEKPAKQKKR